MALPAQLTRGEIMSIKEQDQVVWNEMQADAIPDVTDETPMDHCRVQETSEGRMRARCNWQGSDEKVLVDWDVDTNTDRWYFGDDVDRLIAAKDADHQRTKDLGQKIDDELVKAQAENAQLRSDKEKLVHTYNQLFTAYGELQETESQLRERLDDKESKLSEVKAHRDNLVIDCTTLSMDRDKLRERLAQLETTRQKLHEANQLNSDRYLASRSENERLQKIINDYQALHDEAECDQRGTYPLPEVPAPGGAGGDRTGLNSNEGGG
jgi:regulator of replication initiation timing